MRCLGVIFSHFPGRCDCLNMYLHMDIVDNIHILYDKANGDSNGQSLTNISGIKAT